MRLVFYILGAALLLLGVLAELGVPFLESPPLRLLPLVVLFFLAPLLGAFLLLPRKANIWIFAFILLLSVLQGLLVALLFLHSLLARLAVWPIIEGLSGVQTRLIIGLILAVAVLLLLLARRHGFAIILSVVAFFAVLGALQTLEIVYLPSPTYQFLPKAMLPVLALLGVFLLLRRTTLYVWLIVFLLLGVLHGAEVAIILLLRFLYHVMSAGGQVFGLLHTLQNKTLIVLYVATVFSLLGGALLLKSQKAFYGLLAFFLTLGLLQGVARVINLLPLDLGGGQGQREPARVAAALEPEWASSLINRWTEASASYLIPPEYALAALILLFGAFVFLFLFPLPIGATIWKRSPTGEYADLRALQRYVADFTFRRVLLVALGVLVLALGTLGVSNFLAYVAGDQLLPFVIRPRAVVIVTTLIVGLGAYLLLRPAPVERLAGSFSPNLYEELAVRLRRRTLYGLAALSLVVGLFLALQIARILTGFLPVSLLTPPVAFYGAGALVLVLAAYLLLWPVRIEPVAWKAPPTPALGDPYARNRRLAELKYASLDGYAGPEDIIAAPKDRPMPQNCSAQKNGKTPNDNQTPKPDRLYIAVEGGYVLRLVTLNDDIDQNFGKLEVYADTGGRPLGLALAPKAIGKIAKDDLIVADAYKGLLHVDADRNVHVLCDAAAGRPIGFADAVDIDSQGAIYFTDASTHFSARDHGGIFAASQLDILEHGGSGRLLRYDPETRHTDVLLTGLNFPNGLALSVAEDVLYLSEAGNYSISRYSIGDGRYEVLLDNLPGLPDNIRRGKHGLYWVGLNRPRSWLLDDASQYPFLRKMVARMPIWLRPLPPEHGHVFAFEECANKDGKDIRIVCDLQDPAGSYPSTTGATEIGKRLYIHSLSARGVLGYLAMPERPAPSSIARACE